MAASLQARAEALILGEATPDPLTGSMAEPETSPATEEATDD